MTEAHHGSIQRQRFALALCSKESVAFACVRAILEAAFSRPAGPQAGNEAMCRIERRRNGPADAWRFAHE